MPDPSRSTIVVIGAGFSGAMVTAHLLRRTWDFPVRIVLVNKSGPVARGVAYGTRQSRHVLNVPAGRMSAFPEEEDHFLRFARERMPEVTGGSFVPRGVYGDYLGTIVTDAAARAGDDTFESVRDEARDVRPHPDGQGAVVHLASGQVIEADRVVLALGNYAPSNPRIDDDAFYRSARYVRDPWAPGALAAVRRDHPVLLIGSGLTMLDVALQLAEEGLSAPMLAVSRRGLTPLPHREHGAPPSYGHLPPDLVAGEPSAVAYLRAVRRHVRRLERDLIDWREVVASLRPVTPRLWHALPDREKSRFLRHLRPYWDVHRHRVAPELWQRFDAMRRSGALAVRAARLVSMADVGDQVHASIRGRGAEAVETLRVGHVINCTGPESDVRSLRDPLLDALLASGTVRADAMGLGLDVTDDLALVGRDGRHSRTLSLVGPLLKGTWWEATAVPELRGHAARLAARLHADLAASGVSG